MLPEASWDSASQPSRSQLVSSSGELVSRLLDPTDSDSIGREEA